MSENAKQGKYNVLEKKSGFSSRDIHVVKNDPKQSILITRSYDTPAVNELIADANRADLATDLLREGINRKREYEGRNCFPDDWIDEIDAFLSSVPAQPNYKTQLDTAKMILQQFISEHAKDHAYHALDHVAEDAIDFLFPEMTLKEAEIELASATPIPISEESIQSIVDYVMEKASAPAPIDYKAKYEETWELLKIANATITKTKENYFKKLDADSASAKGEGNV